MEICHRRFRRQLVIYLPDVNLENFMENFWPEGSRVGFASTEELRETLSSTFSLLSFGDGEKELFKKSIETENGDFVPYSCFRKIACDPRTSQTHSARLEATLRHSKLLFPQLREIQKVLEAPFVYMPFILCLFTW